MSTNNQIIQAIAVDIACVGQQLTYLLLPVAQGALSLMARMQMILVDPQIPTQAMPTAMAWMI
jgi:hypothetical protein